MTFPVPPVGEGGLSETVRQRVTSHDYQWVPPPGEDAAGDGSPHRRKPPEKRRRLRRWLARRWRR